MVGFSDRWVRVMADYAADGVWDSEGYAHTPDDLPLSDGLRADIRAWAAWYDRDCEDGMPDPKPFPLDDFAAQGLALARRVKAALPDWTVIYHDEEKAARVRWEHHRAAFEYEITGGPPYPADTAPAVVNHPCHPPRDQE